MSTLNTKRRLYERVSELVAEKAEDLDLRAVRQLVMEHRDVLGHIMTAGKGRNKGAIRKDLKSWIKRNEINMVGGIAQEWDITRYRWMWKDRKMIGTAIVIAFQIEM